MEEVITTLSSELRGLGGAGFPTDESGAPSENSRSKAMAVNGDEESPVPSRTVIL